MICALAPTPGGFVEEVHPHQAALRAYHHGLGRPVARAGAHQPNHEFQRSRARSVGGPASQLLAGCTFKRVSSFKNHGVQLNVANLLDYDKVLVQRITADNTTICRLSIVAPRTWRLTADFEF